MQWVRQGEVSSLNKEDMTVRVIFEGLDTSVSDECSILIPPSSIQKYHMPEVGDTVLCIFTESQGFCVGMLQAATPEMSAEDWGIFFDEDNQVTYKDGKITVTAPEVLITGNLKVTGTISSGSDGP